MHGFDRSGAGDDSSEPLRVLLTIQTMEGPAGGSMYVRDLALELARQGHEPAVYCRRLGPPAQQLLDVGIQVVDCIDRTPRPDIIHGNSPIETVAAVLRWPEAAAVFACHGWGPDALAPRIPGIVRYLPVSEHARDVLLSVYGVPEDRIVMFQNPVDLERFPLRSPLPPVPRKALVFSNTISELNHLPVIRAACMEMGLVLDSLGVATGRVRLDPERVLSAYDIVFAKGRAALEALATGCAVILTDAVGFGELVTTENYDQLRLRNFGLRALRLPSTKETLLAQLKRYDPEDAARVTARVRRTEGLFAAVQRLGEIYREAIAERRRHDPDWESVRAGVARFLDEIAPTSNTFYVAEQLAPLERRLTAAEVRLRRLRETLSLPPLSAQELARVSLRLLHLPCILGVSQQLKATVELHNGTERVLSSLGDNPLHLSYHWLEPSGGYYLHGGMRSEIYPPLAPGQAFVYPVTLRAPRDPGSYVLRIALVQEHVSWSDPLGVFVDVACEVVGSAESSRVGSRGYESLKTRQHADAGTDR
ncbi:MAG: glycosyltransferase [Bryobacterales bacterium]|nr:glycosyltransferase [Bryobacteraceae bacterium]MDW8130269.1 glycosyltransferase [Bryobacterales bacterium]